MATDNLACRSVGMPRQASVFGSVVRAFHGNNETAKFGTPPPRWGVLLVQAPWTSLRQDARQSLRTRAFCVQGGARSKTERAMTRSARVIGARPEPWLPLQRRPAKRAGDHLRPSAFSIR